MINHKQQKGVGLIEVLVSILLLSIAVMGFSTLQMTSVKATGESLKRTQGMSVARGLAEILRINPQSITKVQEVINDNTGDNLKTADRDDPTALVTVLKTSCQSASDRCTSEQLAIRDALIVLESANDYDLNIGMETCAGTVLPAVDNSEVACIIVAWNTTNAFTDPTAAPADTINCANNNGVYYPDADCIILEAY